MGPRSSQRARRLPGRVPRPTPCAHRTPSAPPGAHRTAPPSYRRGSVSENSLVNASPGLFREWHHISKGKSHPCGRYSDSTAKHAACSKGSLARRTGARPVSGRYATLSKRSLTRGAGARAVLQAKWSFQSDTTLCKCYNACKAWYRCTSGGISVKAAPAAPPLRDAPEHSGPTNANASAAHSQVRRDALGQETTHWGRKPPIGAG